MQIFGSGTETYLYLNGIATTRAIQLSDGVTLLPATCDPDPQTIIAMSKSEIDIGVAAIFLRSVRSQLHVVDTGPKELAIRAWNSIWDGILLSAFFDCEAVCNFQCDTPAEAFGPKSQLDVTNYQLRGMSDEEPHMITDEEAAWLEKYFQNASLLLKLDRFMDAANALSSYHWHVHPRVKLAILWAGVEGLFGIDSELAFRLSLYIARFLEPEDSAVRKKVFEDTKRLYKQRSAAVHGAKIKGDTDASVQASVDLLQRLIRRWVEKTALPDVENLAP
jgi:hypothetical protein